MSGGYAGPLPPERFNLARHALSGKPPEKTALIAAGDTTVTLTYGALEDRVLRLAAGFRRSGLEAGSRLLIRMDGQLDAALAFFAANAAGAVPIPTSAMLTAPEAERLIADSGASHVAWDGKLPLLTDAETAVIGPEDFARSIRLPPSSYADTLAADPAYMVYTSGTSAIPKGVIHGQRALWGRRPMYDGWYGLSASDVVLHTGALNWTYTLGTGLCDPFCAGATAVVATGVTDAAQWSALAARHGATLLASVPGLYRQMLRHGFAPPSSLRHGLSAGEALTPSILQRWRKTTGLEIYEAFGMSEISTYISSSPTVPVRPGSPGKPQPGRAVAILDGGRLAVHRSDPGLMLGYWNRPDDTAKVFDGDWFAGGDLGHFDEDGYFWFDGRADDLMNAGGYRVSPLEVESVLFQHPAVLDAGAREWRISPELTIIAAFVVPQPGMSADPAALKAFARERLAAYKCPREIFLVNALPRTANGKLKRNAMAP